MFILSRDEVKFLIGQNHLWGWAGGPGIGIIWLAIPANTVEANRAMHSCGNRSKEKT